MQLAPSIMRPSGRIRNRSTMGGEPASPTVSMLVAARLAAGAKSTRGERENGGEAAKLAMPLDPSPDGGFSGDVSAKPCETEEDTARGGPRAPATGGRSLRSRGGSREKAETMDGARAGRSPGRRRHGAAGGPRRRGPGRWSLALLALAHRYLLERLVFEPGVPEPARTALRRARRRLRRRDGAPAGRGAPAAAPRRTPRRVAGVRLDGDALPRALPDARLRRRCSG